MNVCQLRRITWERMPSHFHSAIHSGRLSQFGRIALQRIGEEKRVGAANIGVIGVFSDELRVKCGVGLPVAHQAMGDSFGCDSGETGQRAHHQILRNPDAEFTGDELVPDEALPLVHFEPGVDHGFALAVVAPFAQRQEAFAYPVVQRFGGGCDRRGKQERDGLGEIADRRVAVSEDPLRYARFGDGPFHELTDFDEPLNAAPDEKVDGPDGVFRSRCAEIGDQGFDLLVGFGGFVERGVEFGERPHSDASSAVSAKSPLSAVSVSPSPSKRVSSARASLPCS